MSFIKTRTTGGKALKQVFPKKPCFVSYTRRIDRIFTEERVVAMTFDNGPMDLPSVPDKFQGRSVTDLILDALKEYQATGTFDVIGDTGENYPDVRGRLGQPDWNGVRFAHYPDINQDERGGAANNDRLMRRILNEGHQAANHGYRCIPFGKKQIGPKKRVFLHELEASVRDLTRLHNLLRDRYGYRMTMGRPSQYADLLSGSFTSYDVYDRLGYLYLGSSFEGGGWVPASRGSAEEIQKRELRAMVEPMHLCLRENPDALRGRIIVHRDGCNMARRTPVTVGLRHQLELLKSCGYRVMSVEKLMEYSPFSDIGPEDPLFEKLVRLQKTRGIVYTDNRLRLDRPMTWGELAMLLAPRREAVRRRLQKMQESRTREHPHWGAMDWCAEQGILKYAMEPDETVKYLPSEFFGPVQDYTRRQIYEAFRG